MFMEFICTRRATKKDGIQWRKEIIGSHDPGMKMKEEKKTISDNNNKNIYVPSNQAQEIWITLVALAML